MEKEYINVIIKSTWSWPDFFNSSLSAIIGCLFTVIFTIVFLRTQERVKQRESLNLEYGKELRRKIQPFRNNLEDIERYLKDFITNDLFHGHLKENLEKMNLDINDLDKYGDTNFEVIYKIAPDLRMFCRNAINITAKIERIIINKKDFEKNENEVKKIDTEILNAKEKSYVIDLSLWGSYIALDNTLQSARDALMEGFDANHDEKILRENVQNALKKDIQYIPYLESKKLDIIKENYSIESNTNELLSNLKKIIPDFYLEIKHLNSLILKNYFKLIYTKKELKKIEKMDYFNL